MQSGRVLYRKNMRVTAKQSQHDRMNEIGYKRLKNGMLKTACIRQLGFLLSFSGTSTVVKITATSKERQNKLCVE